MYVLILVESVKEERVIECRMELGEFERMILPRLEKRTGILKLPNNERVDLTHFVTW